MDVREFRQRLYLLLPRLKQLILDVGFAEMIQDKLDFGALLYQSERIGELRMEDTEVETQPVVSEGFDPVHEIGLDAEVNAFGLDEAANAFDERVFG